MCLGFKHNLLEKVMEIQELCNLEMSTFFKAMESFVNSIIQYSIFVIFITNAIY